MTGKARVEALGPGGEPADWGNFLLITEETRPSGERVFAMTGTAANRGRPTDVNFAYPSLEAALEGAHWLAAKMGVPVIYVREQS
jgi:hypothetical protein